MTKKKSLDFLYVDFHDSFYEEKSNTLSKHIHRQSKAKKVTVARKNDRHLQCY